MTSALAPLRPLVISESAPLRRMMTRSGEPASVSAARKPSAIESTATNTITTPAMPTTATADELRRCGIVRTLSAETASVCVNQRNILRPPQRVRDPEPHRRRRRQRARDHPERAAQDQSHHHIAAPHGEHGQERVVEAAALHGHPGKADAEAAATGR